MSSISFLLPTIKRIYFCKINKSYLSKWSPFHKNYLFKFYNKSSPTSKNPTWTISLSSVSLMDFSPIFNILLIQLLFLNLFLKFTIKLSKLLNHTQHHFPMLRYIQEVKVIKFGNKKIGTPLTKRFGHFN